ncbi:MAG: prohibitin family protein [Deltaproteobacteria bacterium]|nr:prohibitin family protein [Deltaproteobacteria bacterium]
MLQNPGGDPDGSTVLRNVAGGRIFKPLRWVVAVIVLAILYYAVVVVPAGTVGVYDLFGKVSDQVMSPGIHIINPLAKIHRLSVRTQEVKETVDVPSKEGLSVKVDVSLLFSLVPAKGPEVFRTIGYNYVNVVVVPQLRAVVRDVTSGYEAKALYTAEREVITTNVFKALAPILSDRGIRAESTLLRKISLPAKVAAAIESKLEAEQQSEQMKFILEKERQEAERKRIEAKGIADYQTIINQGLNENLLRWKGIEATRELAKSQNAKVVVIGSGKDGLPIILGNQ